MVRLILFFILLNTCTCFAGDSETCIIDVEGGLYSAPSFNDYSGVAFPLIYSYLFVPGDKGNLEPDLAESYEYYADTPAWVVSLKCAVFHDGSPVTSKDVAYSILRGASGMKEVVENIDGIVLFGDRKLGFKLHRPDSDFNHRIAPLEIMQSDGDPANGSGPYQIKYSDGKKLVLQKNPLFYGAIPKIEKIEFHRSNKDMSMRRLIAGKTDIIYDAAGIDIPLSILNDARIRLDRHSMDRKYTLIFNGDSKRPPDLRLRESIARSLGADSIPGETPPGGNVSFKLLTLNLEPYPQIAESIRQSLGGIDVVVDIAFLDPGELAEIWGSKSEPWDAILIEVSDMYQKSPDYWLYLLGSESRGGLFRHPTLSMLKASLPLVQHSERPSIYARMQEFIKEQCIGIPLRPRDGLILSSKRISQPVRFTMFGLRRFAREAEIVEKR